MPSGSVELLADGTHDVIFVQMPIDEKGLHVERLFCEPLFLGMAADDPRS